MVCPVTTSPGVGKHGRVSHRLAELGWELVRCVDTSEPDGGLQEEIGQADFLVVGLVPVKAETLEGETRLEAVLKHGVGVETIDMDLTP